MTILLDGDPPSPDMAPRIDSLPPGPARADRASPPATTSVVSYARFVIDDLTRRAADEASARRIAQRDQVAARPGSAAWW